MMGVPIAGPSYVYGKNMSVIHNTLNTTSILKNKSNSICYEFCAGGCGSKRMSHKPYTDFAKLV